MISVKASFGRRAFVAGFLVALAANTPTPGGAQTNPFAGTWVLNVAKSTFTPGPAPKTQTGTHEVVGAGLRTSATVRDAPGKPTRTQYTANLEGQDYPVTGNAHQDADVLRRARARRRDCA